LGIRVNAILPGYIETDMTAGMYRLLLLSSPAFAKRRMRKITPDCKKILIYTAMTDTARSQALDSIPLKRFGNAEEIADAAIFLATNAYANNCLLNLDGGLSAM
jgi:NAD(P)-dependent dehydrogenase (short-subunit alcohol dehydrogenase family)